MAQIQIFNTTSEELTEEIMTKLRKELENLKKDYQPREPEEYLSRKQAAEMLDINLSTLWSWTNKGLINAYTIGANRIYYKRSDIEAKLKPLNDDE